MEENTKKVNRKRAREIKSLHGGLKRWEDWRERQEE